MERLLLVGGSLASSGGSLLLLLRPSPDSLQLAGGLDLLEQAHDLGVLHFCGNDGSLDLRSGGELGDGALQLNGGLLLGVDHNAGKVRLEALGIQVKRLLGLVAAAVIDGDSLGLGLDLGDSSGLELLEGESTSGADLGVVPLSRAVDSGAKQTSGRAGSDGGGLLLADTRALRLADSLVKLDLHTAEPIFSEVGVGELVVVLHFCCCC